MNSIHGKLTKEGIQAVKHGFHLIKRLRRLNAKRLNAQLL